MPRYRKKEKERLFLSTLKYSLLAVSFTVAAIMVFAFAVKNFDMSDADIAIANQLIKIGGIVYASFYASKHLQETKILGGVIASVMYIVIGYVAFSIVENTLGDLVNLASDAVLACGIGAAVGVFNAKVLCKDKYAKNT